MRRRQNNDRDRGFGRALGEIRVENLLVSRKWKVPRKCPLGTSELGVDQMPAAGGILDPGKRSKWRLGSGRRWHETKSVCRVGVRFVCARRGSAGVGTSFLFRSVRYD